jgi:hypothetical protein
MMIGTGVGLVFIPEPGRDLDEGTPATVTFDGDADVTFDGDADVTFGNE